MKNHLGAAAALASACLLLAACSAQDQAPGGGTDSGPLKVDRGDGGGMGSWPPKGKARYWMTFGLTTLCADVPIELATPVVVWGGTEPSEFRFYLWRMPASAPVSQANKPIISTGGQPPRLFGEKQQGTFEQIATSTTLDQPCPADPKDRPPWVQLLLSVHAGPKTGVATSISLPYTAGGVRHEVVLDDWIYAACGTADDCDQVMDDAS